MVCLLASKGNRRTDQNDSLAEVLPRNRCRDRRRSLGYDGSAVANSSRFADCAKGQSPLRRHLLILLGLFCVTIFGFQVYVVRYAMQHNEETRARLPSICASAPIVRSACVDTVLLAVAFDIMSDKTFPIDTPAAREKVKKTQDMWNISRHTDAVHATWALAHLSGGVRLHK